METPDRSARHSCPKPEQRPKTIGHQTQINDGGSGLSAAARACLRATPVPASAAGRAHRAARRRRVGARLGVGGEVAVRRSAGDHRLGVGKQGQRADRDVETLARYEPPDGDDAVPGAGGGVFGTGGGEPVHPAGHGCPTRAATRCPSAPHPHRIPHRHHHRRASDGPAGATPDSRPPRWSVSRPSVCCPSTRPPAGCCPRPRWAPMPPPSPPDGPTTAAAPGCCWLCRCSVPPYRC